MTPYLAETAFKGVSRVRARDGKLRPMRAPGQVRNALSHARGHTRIVIALWLVALYLAVLYVTFPWGSDGGLGAFPR